MGKTRYKALNPAKRRGKYIYFGQGTGLVGRSPHPRAKAPLYVVDVAVVYVRLVLKQTSILY